MTDQQFFNIFSSDSWIKIPRVVLQQIGTVPAVVLCYIIDKAKYHKTTTIWFDNVELAAKLCGVPSKHIFNKAVDKLEELNLVFTNLKGVPARKHYTINKDGYVQLFTETEDVSFTQNEQLVVKNFNNCLSTDLTTRNQRDEQLSNNTTLNNTTLNNNNEANASKVFTKFISDEFIPNYPKKIQVKRIWTQVTELIKVNDTFSVDQYQDLCGKIRKHLVAYVNTTEKKFLLAPDNYLAAHKWEEDISIPVNKSAKNGAMNDQVNDEYVNFLKSKGL